MGNSVKEVLEIAQKLAASSTLQMQVGSDIDRQTSSPVIQAIEAALEAVSLRDLGVSPTYFIPAVVTYCVLFSTDKFSLVMYCLPAGSALPLHSLPIAFGFSQVVGSRAVYRSFENRGLLPDGTVSADVSVESEVEGTGSFLNTKESLREIRAVEETVVVDLLFGWERGGWKFFEETDRRNESVVFREMKDVQVRMREKGYRGVPLR